MAKSPKRCPSGQILHKGYTRRSPSGKRTRVRSTCIDKQGSTKPRQRASPKAKSRANLKCPPGMIVRKGYVREAYTTSSGKRVPSTRVGAVCIKDIGAPGKGKTRIQSKYKLRKGALTSLGYDVKAPESERRAVLERAIKNGADVNSLKWKLNAQAVYRKNAAKGSARAKIGKRFQSDLDYLKKKYPAKGSLKRSGRKRSPKAKRR